METISKRMLRLIVKLRAVKIQWSKRKLNKTEVEFWKHWEHSDPRATSCQLASDPIIIIIINSLKFPNLKSAAGSEDLMIQA